VAQVVSNAENGAFAQANHLATIEKAPVLPRVVEPPLMTEAVGPGDLELRVKLLAGDGGDKPLATASAATSEDLASVGGLHARAEPVATAALGSAGLVSALHKS
jgi:hypothetical protein